MQPSTRPPLPLRVPESPQRAVQRSGTRAPARAALESPQNAASAGPDLPRASPDLGQLVWIPLILPELIAPAHDITPDDALVDAIDAPTASSQTHEEAAGAKFPDPDPAHPEKRLATRRADHERARPENLRGALVHVSLSANGPLKAAPQAHLQPRIREYTVQSDTVSQQRRCKCLASSRSAPERPGPATVALRRGPAPAPLHAADRLSAALLTSRTSNRAADLNTSWCPDRGRLVVPHGSNGPKTALPNVCKHRSNPLQPTGENAPLRRGTPPRIARPAGKTPASRPREIPPRASGSQVPHIRVFDYSPPARLRLDCLGCPPLAQRPKDGFSLLHSGFLPIFSVGERIRPGRRPQQA